MKFLDYITQKVNDSPDVKLEEIIHQSGGVENVYLIYVDILKGFCDQGPLSSDRLKEMVQPVVHLTNQLMVKGIPEQNLVFLNDHHTEQSVEFDMFAPHCKQNTIEAEVVNELKPIYEKQGVQVYHKNATNGMFGVNREGTRFFEWLDQVFEKENSTFLVVGVCTDLCIYQNALGIRLYANQKNVETNVIVPITHVKTYDTSIEQAEQLNIYPHDGNFMDVAFLYHMKMNGVKVVSTIHG